MRLFIGVELNREIKNELSLSIEHLKGLSQGNFSSSDNLHITLQFLGEKEKEEVAAISKAMKAANGFKTFSLCLNSAGRFERNGESIVWYGLSGETDRLSELHKLVCLSLEKTGISYDKSVFKPHITLARRIKTGISWEEVYSKISAVKKSFTVEKLVLFESTRINGKLTYVPEFTQRF